MNKNQTILKELIKISGLTQKKYAEFHNISSMKLLLFFIS